MAFRFLTGEICLFKNRNILYLTKKTKQKIVDGANCLKSKMRRNHKIRFIICSSTVSCFCGL